MTHEEVRLLERFIDAKVDRFLLVFLRHNKRW